MDFPRLRKGAPPQPSQQHRAPPSPQAMITAPAATPPAQPARGGGRDGRGRLRGEVQDIYYVFPARTEVVASDSVITGIVPVYHRDTSVQFDPGSTYSYVSSYLSPHLGVSRDSLSSPVYVSTPVGDSLVLDRVYRSFFISLSGFETRADLLLLSMVDFDVILGIDWLSPHYAILDCHAKTRMVEKGCDAYLAYVRDVSINTPKVDSVPVVRDFPDVFPADLPGMPPNNDISFGIDLLPGTQPVFIPPYRMDPPKLKDLKEKLQEILDKGFIRPSVSPWGSIDAGR
ncbi:uncharacterized protein [Nicotiana sylvestris]|uniref:uncharacterized protein n=1 Tax=Nicotiana sylvestris TaxID=4096 RepID=UPI00388C6C5F